MTGDARPRLAREQTALLEALVAAGPAPAGFDPERLRIEAATLLAKRRRVVERLRPELAGSLGERFGPLFDTWASARPRRDGVGMHADADAFEAWLVTNGHVRNRRRWFLALARLTRRDHPNSR